MYYNPSTLAQKSVYDLRAMFNASIPADTEVFNGWHLIHLDPQPSVTSRKKAVYSDIVLRDGLYWQTWAVVDKTAEEIAAETAADQQGRLDALEAAVREILEGGE